MPRYYFDLHEGEHEVVDEDGLDCPNIEAAQREAFLALSDIARVEARSSDWFAEVRVRNEAGQPVLIARLALMAERF